MYENTKKMELVVQWTLRYLKINHPNILVIQGVPVISVVSVKNLLEFHDITNMIVRPRLRLLL